MTRDCLSVPTIRFHRQVVRVFQLCLNPSRIGHHLYEIYLVFTSNLVTLHQLYCNGVLSRVKEMSTYSCSRFPADRQLSAFPLEGRGRFHEASFVFSFLKVKEGGFLTFGKAFLKSCFTKPPLLYLTIFPKTNFPSITYKTFKQFILNIKRVNCILAFYIF